MKQSIQQRHAIPAPFKTMADEDNFDIDIYGDIDNDPPTTTTNAYSNIPAVKKDDDELLLDDDEAGSTGPKPLKEEPASEDTSMGAAADNGDNSAANKVPKDDEVSSPTQARKKVPTKRKNPDDRPIDNGSTTALYVADLHWWTTDDDIRGWVNACECEDELKDITFSEHKVNGKSKGYATITIINLPPILSMDSLCLLGLCLLNSLPNKLQLL